MGRRAQGEGRCYSGGTAPVRYSSGRLCSVRLGVMVLRSACPLPHVTVALDNPSAFRMNNVMDYLVAIRLWFLAYWRSYQTV